MTSFKKEKNHFHGMRPLFSKPMFGTRILEMKCY